jgi:hypothetical protein
MDELLAMYVECMNFPPIENNFPFIRPPSCPSPPLEKKEVIVKKVEIKKEESKVQLECDADGIPLPPKNMPVLPPLPKYNPEDFKVAEKKVLLKPPSPKKEVESHEISTDFVKKNQ